jgi:hypothetical protein
MAKEEDRRRLAHATDGRNVDPHLGTLSAEAAEMKLARPLEAFPLELGAAHDDASALLADMAPSYYGLPMLKAPVWTWTIPAYFYVGGAAGASSLLAAALDLRGRSARRLVRRARWLGAAGDLVSAGLLIYDLGRPAPGDRRGSSTCCASFAGLRR